MSTTVDLFGFPKTPKSSPISSIQVAVCTTNGSTGIRAKCFNSIIFAKGYAITYVSDPVASDSFLINVSGLYTISASGTAASADTIAILKNQPGTVGSTSAPTQACILAIGDTYQAGAAVCVTWTGWLDANDFVRVHQAGSSPGTQAGSNTLTITQIPV